MIILRGRMHLFGALLRRGFAIVKVEISEPRSTRFRKLMPDSTIAVCRVDRLLPGPAQPFADGCSWVGYAYRMPA